MEDVAAHAGVSVATVSRVLSGVATVDVSLVVRVREACATLQYQPNRAARLLAGGRSTIIGLLVSDIQNPFFMELVRGVEDVTQRHGYLLVLCNSSEDPRRERAYSEVLCAENIAGAIVTLTQERSSVLSLFRDRSIPVVSVDRRVRDRTIDAVVVNNVVAAQEAVAHLIGNGYRRIAIITGPEGTTTAQERLEGYRLAMREANLPLDLQLERRGPFTMESGRHLAGDLLEVMPRVEALFTANNRLTMGALDAIYARGLHVPNDVALVGFDNVPWVSPGSISLTTVTQPAYELGSTAALRLIHRLQQPEQGARQEIVLGHQLRVGDSSQPRSGSQRRGLTSNGTGTYAKGVPPCTS